VEEVFLKGATLPPFIGDVDASFDPRKLGSRSENKLTSIRMG
jgi:hypothetical protein